MIQARKFLAILIHVVAFLAMSQLAGCLGSEEANSSDDDPSNPPVPGNSAPQISGNAVRSLNFGSAYSFTLPKFNERTALPERLRRKATGLRA